MAQYAKQAWADETGIGDGTLFTAARMNNIEVGVEAADRRRMQFASKATVAPLPAHTRAGNVLTASANGVLSVDGGAPGVNSRVLVKDEPLPEENGVYRVNGTGGPLVPWQLIRDTDYDAAVDFREGAMLWIFNGDVNGTTMWACDGDVTTLNVSPITYTKVGQRYGDLIDAKGDLLVGTANNTLARKAVGADGKLLAADSTDSTGVAWKDSSALVGAKECFRAYRNAAASYATGAPIVFDTKDYDPSNWYDPATGRFTPKIAGWYLLKGQAQVVAAGGGAPPNGKFARVDIRKNGSVDQFGGNEWVTDNTVTFPVPQVLGLVYANGSTDYFEIQLDHNYGATAGVNPFDTVTNFQGFYVSRDHAGSTVTPKTRVARSTNQGIPTSTSTPISFDKNSTGGCYDHGGQWSSGSPTKLTAKVAGVYRIGAQFIWDANQNGVREAFFRKNGSGILMDEIRPTAAPAPGYSRWAQEIEVYLNANDYVELVVWQDSGISLNILGSAVSSLGDYYGCAMTMSLIRDDSMMPLVEEDWKDLAPYLTGNWIPYATTGQYAPTFKKTIDGFVVFKGLLKPSSGTMDVYTGAGGIVMPLGYRPEGEPAVSPGLRGVEPEWIGHAYNGSGYIPFYSFIRDGNDTIPGKIQLITAGIPTSGYIAIDQFTYKAGA